MLSESSGPLSTLPTVAAAKKARHMLTGLCRLRRLEPRWWGSLFLLEFLG